MGIALVCRSPFSPSDHHLSPPCPRFTTNTSRQTTPSSTLIATNTTTTRTPDTIRSPVPTYNDVSGQRLGDVVSPPTSCKLSPKSSSKTPSPRWTPESHSAHNWECESYSSLSTLFSGYTYSISEFVFACAHSRLRLSFVSLF